MRILFSIGNNKTLFIDIKLYHLYAEILLNKGFFAISAYHPPSYPVFITFSYLIMGYSYTGVYLLQSILGAASTYLIYLLGKNAFNKSIGLNAAILSLFYWSLWLYSGILMSEALFIFLLLAGVNLFYLGIGNGKPYCFIIAAVSIALSTLTRSINVLLLPALPLIYLIFKYKEYKKVIRNSVVYILVFVAVMSPWVVRNYLKYNEFILVDTLAGLNMLAGNNDKSKGKYTLLETPEIERLIRTYTHDGRNGKDIDVENKQLREAGIIDKYMKEAAVNIIMKEPIRFIKNTFYRAGRYLILDFTKETDNVLKVYMDKHFVFGSKLIQKAGYYSNLIFYILGVAGLVLLLVFQFRKAFFINFFIVYYFVLTIPFYVVQRYRLPVMPFLAITASVFVYSIYTGLKSKVRT